MGLTSLPPIWTMSLNILFVCFYGTPYLKDSSLLFFDFLILEHSWTRKHFFGNRSHHVLCKVGAVILNIIPPLNSKNAYKPGGIALSSTNLWQFLAVSVNLGQSRAISGNLWQSLAISGYLWLSQTIFNYLWLSRAISIEYQLSGC